MRERADALTDQMECRWPTTLIDEFQLERNAWLQAPVYEPYLRECARFSLMVLRAVAGVYLHVSYDLPRVIAKNWMGSAPWEDEPTEYRAESMYFGLSPLFPESLLNHPDPSSV